MVTVKAPCELSQQRAWRTSDEGATATEYAIMASMIAAVIAATVLLLGGRVNELLESMLAAWP